MIKSWEYQNEYKFLKKDIFKSIDKVLKSGNLFFGNELIKFEKSFWYLVYIVLTCESN